MSNPSAPAEGALSETRPLRPPPTRTVPHAWLAPLSLAALLAYFLTISLRHLTIVPPVFEDEPWFASTGFKLATEGVFGSDVFAGYYGMERRYYGFPPVAPLLLGGVFRLAGFGLLQLRLETVALGLIALVLTYGVGRRLFGPMVGVIAVAFLLLVRMDAVGRWWPTGIFFLDASRIGRYDMPTAVFGLAAFLTYLVARDRGQNAERSRAWLLYGLSGLLAGLSSLSHLYGAFWLLALGVLAIWDRAGWRPIVAVGAGFALPWVPYAAYVLADLHNWAGQMRGYAPRFGLADPLWYLRNLLHEPGRYTPDFWPPSSDWLLRPGLWAGLAAIPISLIALSRRARSDVNARALVVPAILVPVLFALLITQKFRNYKLTVVPLLALAAAWGIWAVWKAADRRPGRTWWRPAMLLVAALVAVEGLVRAAGLERLAKRTSPYHAYIARIRVHVPPGTRVLGLHSFWLGFQDTHYRSWWVPVVQTQRRYHVPELTMQAALRIADPDVVLLDSAMRGYFAKPFEPDDPRPAQIQAWLREGWVLVAAVEDSTYGRMDIYRRRGRGQ